MPMTVREAVQLLITAGFVEVKGGKGSHRKFEKAIDDQYKAFKSSSDWRQIATDFSELLAKLLIEHIGVWDKEFVRISGIQDS